MYKELHPFYYDPMMFHSLGTNAELKAKDYFKPAPVILLKLDTIRRIRPNGMSDETLSLYDLVVSDDFHDNVTVNEIEAEEIKKILVKDTGNSLPKEISFLTAAVRDLWTLLRARLH